MHDRMEMISSASLQVVLFIFCALHENDGYDIQSCMIGITSVLCIQIHTDHICMSLSFSCLCALSGGFVLQYISNGQTQMKKQED